MTKLASALPKGDANGLDAISRRLIDEPGTERRTPCGLLLDQHLWAEHRRPVYRQQTILEHHSNPTWMRFDNASRIARPCKRCFPEGVG